MIKTALSLYIAVILAAGPAAAQMQEGAAAGRSGVGNAGAVGVVSVPGALNSVPVLPAASAGLAGSINPSAAPVIAAIEDAASQPQTLKVLAADPSAASAFARALIAAPAGTPVAPELRSQAVKSLGEATVVRLETAVKTMTAQASATAKGAQALSEVSAGFAALENRVPEETALTPVAAAASKSAHVLSAPKRAWRALKTATLAATMMVTLAVTAPAALGQEAPGGFLPPVVPVEKLLAQAGQTQSEVVQASDINDAIAKWTPQTKVIVIGSNVGLDAAAQKRLAEWLADKHWTVILVQSNSGQVYRDAEGRTHYGKEAIDFGAGQGIRNKAGFSGQILEGHGLSDGSVFVFTMEQRKLFLANSEAQRQAGLDAETEFVSPDNSNPTKLDRFAIERMRAGGDVMGAIKNTVTQLDQLTENALANAARNAKSSVASAKSSLEELAKARAAFERSHPAAAATVGAVDLASLRVQLQRAETALAKKDNGEASRLASAVSSAAGSATSAMSGYVTNLAAGKTAIASARAEVDALEKQSAKFLAAHPKATGDIARPDVRGMRESLKKAEASLASNPSGGKSASEGVVAEIRRIQNALNEHAAGADQIAAQETILSKLEGRERASSAAGDLTTAKQSLREAREAHELGSSDWASQLQTAKSSLANAERAIDSADATAHRNARNWMIFWIFLAVSTLGGSLFLNWRARRAGRKANEELVKWDGILETKLDAVIDQLDSRMDIYVGPISGEKSRGWVDETADLAAKVRKDAGTAKLYLAMARNIHDRATALVRPTAFSWGWIVNQLWPSRFEKAEAMLAHEPLIFTPADGFDHLFEKKGDWREDLYGEAGSYAAVSESFDSVMKKFNANSKTAVAALDEIEKASTGYGAAFDATEQAIGVAAARASQTVLNEYFKVPALGEKAIPAAKEQLAAARAKAGKNPVGAMKGQGAFAERVASDVLATAEKLVAMFQHEVAEIEPIVKALAAASVATKWITDSRSAIDKKATKLADSIAEKAGTEGLAALASSYDSHVSAAKTAKEILDAVASSKVDAGHAEAGVANMRVVLGKALGMPAEEMMREKDLDPSKRLESAAAAFADSLSKLGKGDLEGASAAQKLGADLVLQAVRITTASQHSVENQQKDVDGRIEQAQRLDALQAERAKMLKGIKSEFADSVLKQTAGDASHPSANGTIDDNIDEAQAAIDAAKSKRAKAVQVYREAKVLEAASLLDQAMAHEEIAQIRLDEISNKRARLDSFVAANKSKIEELEGTTRKWKTEIPDDRRTMKPTIKAYEAALETVAAARALVDAKKGDPFKAGASLAEAETELKQLWVKVQNDRDAHAEVVRSLKAAEAQLGSAATQARESQGDGVVDSSAITNALRELNTLKSAYESAVAASGVAHGDWPKVDAEADRITRDAAHVAATLKGEIAAAARATAAISSAANKVREATNWTGSYGVSVPGSPGSGSLSSAKSALNSGDYEGAIRYAESARSAAISAIQTAEAEVARRRREEEEERRRQEEARRRRQQEEDDRRRRSSGGGGGFGGGSGGGGSSWGGGSRSGGGSSGW